MGTTTPAPTRTSATATTRLRQPGRSKGRQQQLRQQQQQQQAHLRQQRQTPPQGKHPKGELGGAQAEAAGGAQATDSRAGPDHRTVREGPGPRQPHSRLPREQKRKRQRFWIGQKPGSEIVRLFLTRPDATRKRKLHSPFQGC